MREGATDFPTLDLPVIHPRTAPYHDRFVLEAGLAMDGEVAPWLRYRLLIEVFHTLAADGEDGTFTAEQAAVFTWPVSEGFAVHGGYRLAFGTYPFGEQVDLLPIAELQWAFDL